MTERFITTTGTISIANGSSTVTGVGTLFSGRDREGATLIARPASGAPFVVGHVAAVDPRGVYTNLTLPLLYPYNGTTLSGSNYALIDGLAIANGATQAAAYARFTAFLEQNAGLAFDTGDTVDTALVPNNSLFVDRALATIKQWRNGVLSTIFSATSIRERLLADRTYYVRTDGSDSNTGLANTSGAAFLTFQKAVNVVHENLDLNGYNITIRAGASSGTFTGAISAVGPFVGAKSRTSVQFLGEATATNFILQTSTAESIFTADEGAQFAVSGFKLTSSGGGGGLDALRGGSILVNGKMNYGAMASWQIAARRQGNIEITVAHAISGGGAAHFQVFNNGVIIATNLAITLSGTPAFTSGFVGATTCGTMGISGNTYAGAATGKQYNVADGGVVKTGGTFASLPGNVAGTSPGGIIN